MAVVVAVVAVVAVVVAVVVVAVVAVVVPSYALVVVVSSWDIPSQAQLGLQDKVPLALWVDRP